MTLIPSFDNIIQTKPNGLFESHCLTHSSLVILDNIQIVDGYNLKEMTYQEGKKYIIVGKSNKRGNEWIFGQLFMLKYSMIFDDTVPVAQIYSKIKDEIPIGVRYVYKPGQYTDKDEEEKDIDITEEPTSLYGGVNKVFAFFVGIVCFCGIFALIYSRVYFLRVAKVQEPITIE